MTRPVAPDHAPSSIHGVAVVIGEAGVLLRGRSGSGKSSLAEHMVAEASARGMFGRVVADDRVRISRCGDRLVLSPHPAIAGRIERRGQGIFDIDHELAAVLRLVVDLVDRIPASDTPPRFPEESDGFTTISGVGAPRLTAAIGDPGVAQAALKALTGKGA